MDQHSELILDFGVHVAQNSASLLNDVSFANYVEEFFLAAMDLKQLVWAQIFLRAICIQFPKNVKTMRFLAMFYESSLNTFKAQELYLEILETTPEDSLTMKRLISLYKNNDLVNDAISMLNKYLESNQCDDEAWLELCDIYLSRQNFAKAQYCFEELITTNPVNYQHNIRYAEILYSNGLASSNSLTLFELSRKYFSHALVLIDDTDNKKGSVVNNNVARALFGLLRVCKQISHVQNPKQRSEDKKNQEVAEIARARLNEIYSKNTSMDISKMNVMQKSEDANEE